MKMNDLAQILVFNSDQESVVQSDEVINRADPS